MMGGEKMKKLEWSKPVIVELGNARRMSLGEDFQTDQSSCHVGTGASSCSFGNRVGEE